MGIVKDLESNRKPHKKLELSMRRFQGADLARALPEGWNFRDHRNFARGGWAFTSPDQQLSFYIFRGGIVKVFKGGLNNPERQEFLTQNEVKKVIVKTSTNPADFNFRIEFKSGEGDLSLLDQNGHYTGVLNRNKIVGIFRRRFEEIPQATIVVPKNSQ